MRELPERQIAKLIADCMTTELYTLPADLADRHDQLAEYVTNLELLQKAWVRRVKCDGGDSFNQFLVMVQVLFACLFAEESRKPKVGVAREAHRHVFTLAGTTLAEAKFAKALGTYVCGRVVMQAALDHSRAGLEDAAASRRVMAFIDKFEKEIEGAFKNGEAWTQVGNNGQPVDVANMGPLVMVLNDTIMAVNAALERWSATALADNLMIVENCFGNFLLLLNLAGRVVIESTARALMHVLPPVEAPPVEAPPDNEPGDALEAGNGEAQGAEALSATLDEKLAHAILATFPSIESDLFEFLTLVMDVVRMASVCMGQLRQRAQGEAAFGNESPLVTGVKVASDQVSFLQTNISQFFQYFVSYAKLCLKADVAETQTSPSMTQAHDLDLVSFCKVHHRHSSVEKLYFDAIGNLLSNDAGERLAYLFNQFVEEWGNSLYAEKVSLSLKRSLDVIDSAFVGIALVHTNIMKEADPFSHLHLLILTPTPDALAKIPMLEGIGAPEQAADFAALAHNKALDFLSCFTDAIALDALKLPRVARPASAHDRIPIAEGLFVLKCMCMQRDIAIIASMLQCEFLVPLGLGHCDEAALVSRVPARLRTLMDMLSDFDGKLNSDSALRIEGDGWALGTSFETLRGWSALLACFAGSFLDTVLRQMSIALNKKTTVLKSSLPSWMAAFDPDGNLNESLAYRMMSGMVANIAGKHNDLHGWMRSMSCVANTLSVQPRLQAHELTSSEIISALDTLRHSTKASIVAMGCDILQHYKNDPDGPAKAAKFLADHRPQAREGIPDGLWAQLKEMAAHSTSTATAKATPTSSPQPKVKSEIASPLPKASGEDPSPATSSTTMGHTPIVQRSAPPSDTSLASSPRPPMPKRELPSTPPSFKRARTADLRDHS